MRKAEVPVPPPYAGRGVAGVWIPRTPYPEDLLFFDPNGTLYRLGPEGWAEHHLRPVDREEALRALALWLRLSRPWLVYDPEALRTLLDAGETRAAA